MIAVLLGPWAAVIAESVALAVQALFFGDGGILAYSANAFNMAFVMPVVGYAVYRLVAQRLSLTSPRRALAAGLGGYIGLNVAAMCAAIEFGLQAVVTARILVANFDGLLSGLDCSCLFYASHFAITVSPASAGAIGFFSKFVFKKRGACNKKCS